MARLTILKEIIMTLANYFYFCGCVYIAFISSGMLSILMDFKKRAKKAKNHKIDFITDDALGAILPSLFLGLIASLLPIINTILFVICCTIIIDFATNFTVSKYANIACNQIEKIWDNFKKTLYEGD